MIKETN